MSEMNESPHEVNDGDYQEQTAMFNNVSKKKTFNFKAVVSDKGSKRTLFIVLGIAGFALVVGLWPHSQKKIPKTSAAGIPQLTTPQGSEVPTQQYSNELQEANKQRAQQALQSGGSALPTMQLPPIASTPAVDLGQGGYSGEQPPPPPILPSTPPPASAPSTVRQAAKTYPVYNIQPDTERTQNMAQYMAKLSSNVPEAELVDFSGHEHSANADGNTGGFAGQDAAPSAHQQTSTDAATQAAINPQEQGPFSAPVIGTVLYSTLITGADSDAPGPILGEIEQGPLTGARLMGGFTTSSQGMSITFKTMIVPYKSADGTSKTQVIPINAIAVDTSTMTDNVATSVNNHLAERLGVAFVTSLLGDYGQLVSQSGANTVINSSGSIATSNPTLSTKKQFEAAGGQAIGQAGEIFSQVYGNIPTTIKAAPGTSFGLLFLADSEN